MTSTERPVALDLPIPSLDELPTETRRYFDICVEKLGMIPNVLRAYSQNLAQMNAFTHIYNELMLGESELDKLEREMVAVVVSAENRCFYCLVAHGAAVRTLSGDPVLGEHLVMNYRSANLSPRHRAMLDYASLLTRTPAQVTEADADELRRQGFSDRAIWDLSNVIGFYNMTNRVAIASDMKPNPEYHNQDRQPTA
ncbi:MAG: peroxidase-related enzyme [Marinobacter sp.]|uniref:peroxidase-related enzyme n=1 Tax=Marinobacter sp. TaxID=50741 RepID=UPI00299E6EC3|nr:peroxidase-related enzyme [Marinobacter sp.]MDX1635363.1 peroxidase-related enzyme [Marinobacter sp.]